MINFHTRDQRVILAGTTVIELNLEAEATRTLVLTGGRKKLVDRVEARWQRTLDQILEQPSSYLAFVTWSGRNILKGGDLGAEWSERSPRATAQSRTIVNMRTIEDILAIQVQRDQEAAVDALQRRMEAMG